LLITLIACFDAKISNICVAYIRGWGLVKAYRCVQERGVVKISGFTAYVRYGCP